MTSARPYAMHLLTERERAILVLIGRKHQDLLSASRRLDPQIVGRIRKVEPAETINGRAGSNDPLND